MAIDRTGEIHGILQITEELRENKVKAQCLICGSIKEYFKNSIVKGTASCSCTRIRSRLIDKTGQTFNNLKIIKELGNERVIAKCRLCGSEKEYRKSKITNGDTKSCGCTKDKDKIIDRTGQIFSTFKIIKELGGCMVIAKCTQCTHQDYYKKAVIIRGSISCKNCGVDNGTAYRGKIINNIKIIKMAYTGRDGNRYYNCECIKCKERLVLTHEEIIKYTCDME